MYCVHCGKQTPDDSDYCTHCGKPLIKQPTDIKQQPKSRHIPKIFKILAIIIAVCLLIGVVSNLIGIIILKSRLSHKWITYSNEAPALSLSLNFLDREVIYNMAIFGATQNTDIYTYRPISYNKVIVGDAGLVFNVVFYDDTTMYLYSEDTDLWQDYIWVIDD